MQSYSQHGTFDISFTVVNGVAINIQGGRVTDTSQYGSFYDGNLALYAGECICSTKGRLLCDS